MEKIRIKENKILCNMDEYLKPEFIYIPINNSNYLKGDYIYRNDMIDNNIYSPISGYVREDINKYIGNKKTKCMVIENDYKEKYRNNNYVFDKEKFINTLKNNKLIDIYDNYDVKYLIINAIDIEPYIFSKRLYINKYTKSILNIIDCIMNKLNITKSVIAVTSLYDNLISYIGTYPNIKIVRIDNYYPVSNDRLLLKELFGITYNKTSLEKKIWVVDLLSLFDIESIIKNNKMGNEMIITVGGSFIKNCVMKIKIGTSFEEIIQYLGGSKENSIITIGGPLTGKQIDNDEFIITKEINAIFVTENRFVNERECILCGKCNSVCPVNLIPVFIMKNIDNKRLLNKLNVNKCIECGLCSYICPSNVNLKKYIAKAKEVINNE